MSVVTDATRPVRPGWTLPILGVGLVIGLAGLLVARGALPARTLCTWMTTVHSEDLFGESGVGRGPNCTPIDTRYVIGEALAWLGLAVAITASIGLGLRSRQATKAESPWRTHRATASAAQCLNRHLARSSDSKMRVRPGLLTALGVVLILGALAGGAAAWQSYRHSQQAQGFNRAVAALAQIRLPQSLRREANYGCGGEVCAQSTLTPLQVEPIYRRLFHAAPNDVFCTRRPTGVDVPCPLKVFAEFHGYPLVAIAFWHLTVVMPGQRAPSGSVPYPGHRGRIYETGSTVAIELAAIEPDARA